jgi:hypothetical protein
MWGSEHVSSFVGGGGGWGGAGEGGGGEEEEGGGGAVAEVLLATAMLETPATAAEVEMELGACHMPSR